MRWEPWAPQLQLLRDLYPHFPTKDLVERFGRPESAITREAMKQGLKKTDECISHINSARRVGVEPVKRHVFIEDCRKILARPEGASLSEMVALAGIAYTNGKAYLRKAAAREELFSSGEPQSARRYYLSAEAAIVGCEIDDRKRALHKAAMKEIYRQRSSIRHREKIAARPPREPKTRVYKPRPVNPMVAERKRLAAEQKAAAAKERAEAKLAAKQAKAELKKSWVANKVKHVNFPHPTARPSKQGLANWKDQEAVIPSHVVIQVCPSGVDTRFKAVGPVVGGFASAGIGRYLSIQETQ